MVKLGFFEVTVEPDQGIYDDGVLQSDNHPKPMTGRQCPPHPVHQALTEFQDESEPTISSEQRSKYALHYLILKTADYYEINLAIYRGLFLTGSERVIFELFIDGQRRDGITANQFFLKGGEKRWSEIVRGVSYQGRGIHKHHRFRCKCEFDCWSVANDKI